MQKKMISIRITPTILMLVVMICVTFLSTDSSCNSEVNGKQNSTLSTEQRLYGLAEVWSEIKYNYPMWHRLDDLDWDAEFNKRLQGVMIDQSDFDYFRNLQNFVSLIRDDHVGVYLSADMFKKYCSEPAIKLWRIGTSYAIIAYRKNIDSDGLISLGDEVISINGMLAKDYADRYVMPYIGASTRQSLDLQSARDLLRGIKGSSVLVKLRKADGTEFNVRLTRGTDEDGSWIFYRPFFSDVLISHSMIKNGIGYIKIGNFGESQVVDKFLEALQSFSVIESLIIDLRANGGGNSDNGDQIISHLIQEPVQGMMEKRAYYSATLRGWGQGDQGSGITWKNYHTPESILPSSEAPNFHGKLVLLTSPGTASAAEDFVGPLKSSGRAFIIGETTCGSTGNPLYFELPGGGRFRLCSRYMLLPDGTEFIGIGIAPDIVVSIKLSDIAEGRDPVLERAITELSKQ